MALIVTALGTILRKSPNSRTNLQRLVDQLSSGEKDAAVAYLRREWQVLLVALLAGMAASVTVFFLGGSLTSLHGLPYALAGVVGALVALLVVNLWPRVQWLEGERQTRVADLEPRNSMSFGRQWVFVLPLVSAVLLILGLVLAGSYSSTDENGLHRIYAYRGLSGWGVDGGQVVDIQYNMNATGPFPGWFYGVPLVACTVLFIVAVYWTLRRIALAPRPMSPELFTLDNALRSLQTRFVMAFSSAALGFQLAGLGFVTGIALLNANRDPVPTADLSAVPSTVAVEPGHTLAIVLMVVSVAIAVTGLVLLFRAIAAVSDAVAASHGIRRPVERVPF
ncbi:hypothetical protein ACFSFX_09710 [Arthrobacter flavus]|uniref:FtsX-like permease family protein n=1 Tax=Arthrobacter flavus TaxID=95172 RepID=A0ABW4Q7Z4_9MICC